MNLPADVKSFVGRRRELREARRLLGKSRLLTLVGVGGVGKTQLAIRVASEVRRTFPDGVWLAELAPLEEGDLVPHAVLSALGLRDQSARPPLDTLSDHLADKQLLLLLDNCEHLLDETAILAAKLLSRAGGLRILATSRQFLNVEGEQVMDVPPLPAPDPDRLFAAGSPVTGYEAVSLFADRAAAVVPDFEITAENSAAVGRLCWLLDGIPLAIELAAVHLRSLSVDQILDRLDDRFRLLIRRSNTGPTRHQTLKAAIEWSYDLCSPQERSLWERLSVFSGGFDLEAAENTCSGGEIQRADVYELVAGLVGKSILAREDHGSRMRYQLLETVRQYGRERLAESGEERTLRSLHRDYYLDLAVQAESEFFGPQQAEWFPKLRRDLSNVRVALDFCLSDPARAQEALDAAAALKLYWLYYGLLGEGRQWLTQAMKLDPTPTVIRNKALAVATHVTILQGDTDAARRMRDECAAIAERFGDKSMLAHAMHASGMVTWAQGDLREAIAQLREALRLSLTYGDDAAEGFLDRLFLSMAASLTGDARSDAFTQETLDAADEAGAQWCIAWAIWVRGLHEWGAGNIQQATDLFQDALRRNRVLYNEWSFAWCTEALAWTAAAAGQDERAARLLGATQACLKQMGGLGGFNLFAAAHERCEAQLRENLGEDAYAEALRSGAKLSLEEIIVYALGEEPPVPARAAPRSDDAGPAIPAPETTHALTRRERQVAELITEGLSNKQIATKLVIGQRTAESHVENILTKLGFNSRTQIASWLASGAGARDGAAGTDQAE
jgi:predicted ATPase/DNA-binding CsgD family transcriptional regulator